MHSNLTNNPEEFIRLFVYRHIYVFSFIFPLIKKNMYDFDFILEKNSDEVKEIIKKLSFYLDDSDSKKNIYDIPFISCMCKFLNITNCCDIGERLYTIKNFQYSNPYQQYIKKYNIKKTYILEYMNKIYKICKHDCFINCDEEHKYIFLNLINYIRKNWMVI